MRVALIANAGSGSGTDPEALAGRLRAAGAEATVHGISELDAVRRARPERVVAAGGDGTIARAAALAGELGVPLAVVPAGTANDFARGQGIPGDVATACELAVRGHRLRTLDLGRLGDGTPFVNVASAGLAAVAARRAATYKSRLGRLAYAVGALRSAAAEHPLTVVALADSVPVFRGQAWQVIVAVTGTFGGGSRVDVADPQDGMLDVAVVPAGSRAGLARRAIGMRTGGLADQRGVVHARGCSVELHMAAGTELNVDGEVVRAAEPERLRLESRAFALVVPHGPNHR